MDSLLSFRDVIMSPDSIEEVMPEPHAKAAARPQKGISMTAATVSSPLVTLALPQDRPARLIAQMLLVIGGTILMALAAKVTVPFWPVPMTLQTLAVFVISAAYGRNLAVATM